MYRKSTDIKSTLLAFEMLYYFKNIFCTGYYRPRSEGDNALGSVRLSVRPSVCLSVCLSVLSRLNRLTYDLDFWYGGRP